MEFIWPVFTYVLFGIGSALAVDLMKGEDADEGIPPGALIFAAFFWPLVLIIALFTMANDQIRKRIR